ncbi:nitroreductase [Thermoplasmatota archaeon]
MIKEHNNAVIKAINNRRSCRDFEQKPIPRDILKTIIEAGNQAPFVADMGFQPWRFVVVEDLDFKKELVQTTFPIWKKSMENMKEALPQIYNTAMKVYDDMPEPKDLVYYSAPAIIFVIGPKNHTIDCALACENMMIAATSFSLGSCYVGFGAMVKSNSEVVSELELKDNEQIFGPILLGYPKEDTEAFVANGLSHLVPIKKESQIKWI